MNLSLSTMWWGDAVDSLKEWVRRTRDLGFSQVELDYRRSAETLPQLRETLAAADLSISSLHAPFPRPPVGDPLRQADLAAVEAGARRRAESLVARTLQQAAALGAPVVVLHGGNLRELEPLERVLDDLYRKGRLAGEDSRLLKQELQDRRSAEAPRRLNWVREALDRLVPQAASLEVVLALENRAHFRDLPSFEEMGQLLREYGPQLGYWHDMGHAFRLEELGFYPQAAWLRAYESHLVGMHLHDAVGQEDHQPPGRGVIPFDRLVPLFPERALRVLEVSTEHSEEHLAAGLAYLRSVGVFS